MRASNRSILIFSCSLLLTPPTGVAAQDSGPTVTTLLSTGTTITGEALRYPASGPAHVTAEIVTLPPGGRTALHKHGVPMFAYILDGELTVDYGDRGKRTYHKGDSIMETMDVTHFGADAGSQPVRILVVFMGAEGLADTIPVK